VLQAGPVMTRLESPRGSPRRPMLGRAPKPGRLQVLSQPAETGQRRQPGRVRFAVLPTMRAGCDTIEGREGHGSVTLPLPGLRADSNGTSA